MSKCYNEVEPCWKEDQSCQFIRNNCIRTCRGKEEMTQEQFKSR